ncbi:hypothetical protein [Actinomadura xylanilytica]|nr:hypothetical protein [Actinomadura xylanilytica]MDL4770724.1 hypothetical protein [Actinomadura xylanilytica]
MGAVVAGGAVAGAGVGERVAGQLGGREPGEELADAGEVGEQIK